MSYGHGDPAAQPPPDPWAPPGATPPGPPGPYAQAGPYAPAPYAQPGPYAPPGPYGAYWPGPPVPPPKRSRGRVVAVVAGITAFVLVLVGIGVAGALHATNQDRATAQSLSAARAKIETEIPLLTQFIAKDRGLAWVTQPKAEVLADDDFVAALKAAGRGPDPYDYKADPDDLATTYTAMGLVASPDAFDQAQSTADASGVIGFYDDQTTRLVVRGAAWTPSMEYTLVHELTHALQDQTFHLGTLRRAVRYDDETALTLQSVIEGDAERVADDYYDLQSPSWQSSVDADQSQGTASSVPLVDTLDGIPYVVGETFVTDVYGAGGNAAVDRAFTHPPTTSQQLLHAAQWLAGTLPAPPRPAWPSLGPGDLADRGVLGEIGFWLTVDAADPHLAATAALDGWDGDAYTATSSDTQACFKDLAMFTSASTRDKALVFLKPWLTGDKIQSKASGDTGVLLTSCHGLG